MKEYLAAFKVSYKSILIGCVGGYAASYTLLPLPWLLGALIANLVFSFTKFEIKFDKKIFLPVLLVIGVILAGSFNISLLYKIHLWIFSSIAMIICTIIGSIVTAFYLYKICKFKKVVAILAGLPGAFVVIAGALEDLADNKKDRARVIIPQATRVLFIVLFVPFIFLASEGYQEIGANDYKATYNLRYFSELVFLLGISHLLSILLERFTIPSAPILAAMLAAGFFYTLEITTAKFPPLFINIAFVFLGSAIGCRLNGLGIKEIIFYSFHGAVISILLLGIAAIFAYFLNIWFGFDFIATLLSFAPGGLHEMVIISAAYNIDPLFVSYHHFLRVFFIIFAIPFIVKFFKKKK
ncbi:PEP phosphonomutase and related enzymes-like protein [Candidatus Pelagibacter sp. IMCC9063]|jgi:membrane AbrB-like protein|uniref:AbrB family transcriptional regulator n=1 Tax=Pelagibacter sp. (strain IMCC9063) TaxID=1002672 RepID=UPI0002046581|nr:AbrB family transcriptional regulator [Candidatus Pelagibacter sp. IMCC9063]AEA81271.1 PEP phosphonomutase and related enzymes-like protein [Candidatus Pelagibacter sp. IMCC9063]|tara:strand:+ start:105 stop:1163 length:1059 start_codon:yes stop_codon:yes gene_type:complete